MKMKPGLFLFALLASAAASTPALARCGGKIVRDNCDNPYCCPKDYSGSDPDPSVCTPPRGGALDCHGGYNGGESREESVNKEVPDEV